MGLHRQHRDLPVDQTAFSAAQEVLALGKLFPADLNLAQLDKPIENSTQWILQK
jgi:hypothetical protein